MATLSSPSEIARETLKALAARKLAPTPDNYAQAYQEITGVKQEPAGAVAVIEQLALHLTQDSPQKAPIKQALQLAISTQNWAQCQKELQNLVTPTTDTSDKSNPALAWSSMIRDLLRQLDIPHKGLTTTRKKEGVETVLTRFSKDPAILHEKLNSLVRSWSSGTSAASEGL